MKEFLLGSWGPRLAAGIKQHPLEVLATVVTAVSLGLTLLLGVRGSGSGDSGSTSFGDGDGGGCGGD